jgi:hypothetical protein
MKLTPAERALLQQVADRDPMFGNQNVQDPAEHARLDGELRELRKLQPRGLVTVNPQRESMTALGGWYLLAPQITDAGRKALAGEQ